MLADRADLQAVSQAGERTSVDSHYRYPVQPYFSSIFLEPLLYLYLRTNRDRLPCK